jgi:Protein of unknown function, DUF417
MNTVVTQLARSRLLEGDLDYHLIRASMVILFLFFGYTKWFEYAAQIMVPFPSESPLLSASSMNVTKARAFALARRPVGNTAHSSIAGTVQSVNTALTAPLFNSGNIHSDATTNPRPERTAARTPSAAVTRTRPVTLTDISVLPFLNIHAVPPPRTS